MPYGRPYTRTYGRYGGNSRRSRYRRSHTGYRRSRRF